MIFHRSSFIAKIGKHCFMNFIRYQSFESRHSQLQRNSLGRNKLSSTPGNSLDVLEVSLNNKLKDQNV